MNYWKTNYHTARLVYIRDAKSIFENLRDVTEYNAHSQNWIYIYCSSEDLKSSQIVFCSMKHMKANQDDYSYTIRFLTIAPSYEFCPDFSQIVRAYYAQSFCHYIHKIEVPFYGDHGLSIFHMAWVLALHSRLRKQLTKFLRAEPPQPLSNRDSSISIFLQSHIPELSPEYYYIRAMKDLHHWKYHLKAIFDDWQHKWQGMDIKFCLRDDETMETKEQYPIKKMTSIILSTLVPTAQSINQSSNQKCLNEPNKFTNS